MSNNPNNPADFGSKQFQKIQFAHKPHQEIKNTDVEKQLRDRVRKPAKILRLVALISVAATILSMLGYCGTLAIQRDEWVNSWNQQVLAEHRARKQVGARGNEISKQEEQEIKLQTDWNKNSYTIMMGFSFVSFLAFACISVFVAVSAHKMMNMKGYVQGIVACIICLIPFLSPLIIVGLPLGIWLLIILKDPQIRRTFQLMKS